MVLSIESRERFTDEDFMLFEDEEVALEVNLEIETEDSDYGRSVKHIKAHFISAYSNEECEDLELNLLEKREIEKYLENNLIINLQ
ncbi:hypothetical protein [Chryseobacterium proteolyticum]|uniref:hypothetical protein n=1 Tax=Chryseobacterium proteolyticum TaxID=118127 RepID=UPI003983B986